MPGEIPPQNQRLANGLKLAASLGLRQEDALMQVHCPLGHGGEMSIAEGLVDPEASRFLRGAVTQAVEIAGQKGKDPEEIDSVAVGANLVQVIGLGAIVRDPEATDNIKRTELPSGFAAYLESTAGPGTVDQDGAEAQKKRPNLLGAIGRTLKQRKQSSSQPTR